MTPKLVTLAAAARMLEGTRINHTMLRQPRPQRPTPADTQFVHTPPPRANNTDPGSRECKRRRKQMEKRG